MATRKVTLNLEVCVTITLEEGIFIQDVINEMDYNFNLQDEHGELVDSEIINYEVTNSK